MTHLFDAPISTEEEVPFETASSPTRQRLLDTELVFLAGAGAHALGDLRGDVVEVRQQAGHDLKGLFVPAVGS